MQAMRLSRWEIEIPRGRLQSWTGQGLTANRPTPARIPTGRWISFLSGQILTDVLKRNDLLRVGFWNACTNAPAEAGTSGSGSL